MPATLSTTERSSSHSQLSLDSHALTLVNEVTDLGVSYDSSLKFSTHIAKIVAKAHSRANLIMRCFVSGDTVSLMRAFNVFVRPIIEYSSVVWNPYLIKDIDAIETV